MNEFKELGLEKELIDVLEELRFKVPSEIQKKTIPLILNNKDVIGNASTGSGKTLAFASGILEKAKKRGGIQALVLTPTRELAEQITQVMKKFSKNYGLNIQEIYGGVGFDNQVRGSRNAEVIVGTPGRILDHLQRGTFDFSKVKILVLDEADRMVDMGFLPDVDKIISQCNKDRQTLLFSATTSTTVTHISKKYMKDVEEITVEKHVDPSKLKQIYYDVPSQLKFSLLAHFLKSERSGIVMVFCNTRRNVDLVEANLNKYKIHCHTIHGGLDQKKRGRIIEKFRNNQADILICTDVAARGLDIKDVSHVYNYDTPKTSEDYIHRIGRTARAGKEGKAITILSNRDYENFRNVLKDDTIKIEKKEMPKIEKLNPNFKSEPRFQRGSHGRPRDSGRRDNRRNDKRTPSRGRSQGSRDNRRDSESRPRSQDNREHSRNKDNKGIYNRSRTNNKRDSNREDKRDSRGARGDRKSYNRDSRSKDTRGDRKPTNRNRDNRKTPIRGRPDNRDRKSYENKDRKPARGARDGKRSATKSRNDRRTAHREDRGNYSKRK